MWRSNFTDVGHVRKTPSPNFNRHTHPTARLKGKTWQNKRGGEILIKITRDYVHIFLSKPVLKKREKSVKS